FSGAGWVDAEYLTNNGNNSPATFNGLGPHNQFASATREMSGGTGELLDAFMWDNGNVCSIPVDFKLGRHTLLWGEALFFADNGIMYGQAPIDILKALSVPATEAKELFMPVGQFSFQIQPTKTFAVVGFLDFEWRRDRLPPAGSYYSNGDLLDAGGERILLG